jgi:hypothetical protein
MMEALLVDWGIGRGRRHAGTITESEVDTDRLSAFNVREFGGYFSIADSESDEDVNAAAAVRHTGTLDTRVRFVASEFPSCLPASQPAQE